MGCDINHVCKNPYTLAIAERRRRGNSPKSDPPFGEEYIGFATSMQDIDAVYGHRRVVETGYFRVDTV